ncbi:hypothetical protein P0Y67_05595 [Photobacterium sp. SP02]|uniref:hypothetical protein n=1 Tax=Photobacterium sp. SP02 TaxID=3032280 RepID=UPI003145081E
MSEYQSYRFERLDGVLDSKQRQALRQISSRAEITATSFQVYYHYSGLKAETADVVLNYFDIGFYYADWGFIEAYIKLPIGTIPEDLLQSGDHGFYVHATDQWQLLVFSLEEYDDYLDDEQADDFFQHLASLRSELIQGDWRLLYFMWLRELDSNDELAAVPMINFDFNHLSDAQTAFAGLFGVPLGLVKALALALEEKPSHSAKHNRFHIDDWLSQLSEKEKDQLLTALFEQGQLSRHQALAMTRKEQVNEPVNYQHWLSAQIIEPYIAIAQQQLKQEQAIALATRLAAEKAAKEAKLSEVYNQRDQVWQRAQEQASRTCASGYDQASRYLHQLAEAYQFKGEALDFECRFERFISSNNSRKALLNRLQDLLPRA